MTVPCYEDNSASSYVDGTAQVVQQPKSRQDAGCSASMSITFYSEHMELKQTLELPRSESRRQEYMRTYSHCLAIFQRCTGSSCTCSTMSGKHQVALQMPIQHIEKLPLIRDVRASTMIHHVNEEETSSENVTEASDRPEGVIFYPPESSWAMLSVLSLLEEISTPARLFEAEGEPSPCFESSAGMLSTRSWTGSHPVIDASAINISVVTLAFQASTVYRCMCSCQG
jgi:hypothetical protein